MTMMYVAVLILISGALANPAHQRIQRSLPSHGDQQAILDKHNELRRQEGSSNMKELIWNDELARMADEWARGCDFEHGQPGRENPPFNNKLGQNLYYNTADFDMETVLSGVQSWYDEKYDYDFNTGDCTWVCTHYTQLVWAKTKEVGCAWTSCNSLAAWGGSVPNANYLVCNYGPRGNWDKEVYKKGAACDRCDAPDNKCVRDLCTSSSGADNGDQGDHGDNGDQGEQGDHGDHGDCTRSSKSVIQDSASYLKMLKKKTQELNSVMEKEMDGEMQLKNVQHGNQNEVLKKFLKYLQLHIKETTT